MRSSVSVCSLINKVYRNSYLKYRVFLNLVNTFRKQQLEVSLLIIRICSYNPSGYGYFYWMPIWKYVEKLQWTRHCPRHFWCIYSERKLTLVWIAFCIMWANIMSWNGYERKVIGIWSRRGFFQGEALSSHSDWADPTDYCLVLCLLNISLKKDLNMN